MRLGIFNRRFFVMTCIAGLVMAFAACEKSSSSSDNGSNPNNSGNNDNPLVINAKNVINAFEYDSSINNIVNVKAFVVLFNYLNSPMMSYNEVISGIYKDNGFNLTLPTTVSDDYLWKIAGNPNFPVNLVSDKEAKIGSIMIAAYNNAGEQIGFFSSSDISTAEMINTETESSMFITTYYYADRAFTLEGNIKNGERVVEYDCSYKKGWNIGYMKQEYKNGVGAYGSLITTKKPSNVNFHWYYYPGTLPNF